MEEFHLENIIANQNLTMGFLYADRGKFDKARQAFQSLFDYVEKNYPAYLDNFKAYHRFVLGLTELKQGRLEAAKACLTEFEALYPKLMDWADKEGFALYGRLLGAEVALAGNSIEQAVGIGEKIEFLGLWSVNIMNVLAQNLPFQKDVLARAY